MVGLILLLLALAGGAEAGEDETLAQQRARRSLEQLHAWLQRDPALPAWRGAVFQKLSWLERIDDPAVHLAWMELARGGSDADEANLLLYRRRQGLPLGALADRLEGPEVCLEYALFLWGESRLQEAASALGDFVQRYPADARFRDNLDWLLERQPPSFSCDGDARATALAVMLQRQRALAGG